MKVAVLSAVVLSASTAQGASLARNILPRAALVMYCRFQNFRGTLCAVDIDKPEQCVNIPVAYANGVESIEVSESATCQFFTELDCTGPFYLADGLTPVVPEPYIDNTLSYKCTPKAPIGPTPSPSQPGPGPATSVLPAPTSAAAAAPAPSSTEAPSPGGSAKRSE